ncbi:MAG: transcriptional repressor NrdR [Candidatus Actinomarinales bacterium]|nr:MAG: transcriptional repressor NrdR [Candidatus Actinomarinales bacterium]|tara:strand:- start:3313 stop:3753 length:441 start_codon:yes stop_codon:yes gene_type:complete
MVCPFCNAEDTAVIDSRRNSEGSSIRRRRKCPSCDSRFTTYEKSEIELIVKKRNGNLEEFQYEKLQKGIESAFGGQEISEKKLKGLVDEIFIEVKKSGKKVNSDSIGETVLEYLKKENEVAYLRFASVYKEFSNVSDFEKEAAEFN